jgi:hypothetical protein
MKTPSYNGRQAWVVLNDGLSDYNKAIYGLDYSKTEINIDYLQAHPEELAKFKRTEKSTLAALRGKLRELDRVAKVLIPSMLGPLGIFFSMYGLLVLVQRKSGDLPILVLVPAFAILIPPLSTVPEPRNFLAALPLLWLLCGLGVWKFTLDYQGKKAALVMSLVSFFVVLQHAKPLEQVIRARQPDLRRGIEEREYSRALIDLVGTGVPDQRVIVGRDLWVEFERQSVGDFSSIVDLPLPATDYDGLLYYCQQNKADYIAIKSGDQSFDDCVAAMLTEKDFKLVDRRQVFEKDCLFFKVQPNRQ